MKIFILAGGFATRLWPLTENRAKPLLLLDGQTILAHILSKCDFIDPADIYLLTNNKFVQNFESELKNLELESVNIFVEDAENDGEKLGALGAISKLVQDEKIEDDILVLAGDNLLPDLDLNNLIGSSDQAILAVRDIKDLYEARKFGVVEIKESTDKKQTETLCEVIGFEEKPEHPKSTLVSTAFMFFGKTLLPMFIDFAKKEPDALGGIFPELLRQNQTVKAFKAESDWFDVGSFETYLSAHQLLQDSAVKISKNTRESGNDFAGKVFVGENCVIENCRLINCIIYPGTTLKHCHVAHTVIDKDCAFENVDLNQKLVRAGTALKG